MELNNLRAMASGSARETESELVSSLSLLVLPLSLLPLSKCVFNLLLDLAPASSLSDPEVIMDDEVTQAVEKVMKEWEETSSSVENNVKAIEAFGTSVDGITKEENSHHRSQDGLALLRSLQFRLDLFAQQLLTKEQVRFAQSTLKSWKDQYQSLHLGLKNANLQAQTNMRKASETKRELI